MTIVSRFIKARIFATDLQTNSMNNQQIIKLNLGN